jgi:hypothetical protein
MPMCGSCTAALTNIGDVLGITVDIEVLGPQAKANIMHMAMGWQLKANVQDFGGATSPRAAEGVHVREPAVVLCGRRRRGLRAGHDAGGCRS